MTGWVGRGGTGAVTGRRDRSISVDNGLNDVMDLRREQSVGQPKVDWSLPSALCEADSEAELTW